MNRWMFVFGIGLLGLVVGISQGCSQGSVGELPLCHQDTDCPLHQMCVAKICVSANKQTEALVDAPPPHVEKQAQESGASEPDRDHASLEPHRDAREPASEPGAQETRTEPNQESGNEATADASSQDASPPEHQDPDTLPPEQQDPCSDPKNAKAEECNGIDDDCDGAVDNIRGTDKPLKEPCFDGFPSQLASGTPCRKGTTTCQNGVWGRCEGQVLATNETCNGKDDDCNGKIDDNIAEVGQGCTLTGKAGECAKGKKFCESQGIVCRQVHFLRTELCNGKDDDCDGQIDNLTRECYSGPGKTAGVGACKKGVQACKNGTWEQICTGEVLPQKTELCDGVTDEDCDGQVDEGCRCVGKATQPCGTNQGECKPGTQTCDRGQWGKCEKSKGPKPEICDGKDNDCDGQTDEGNPGGGGTCTVKGAQGVCQQGTKTCQGGALVCLSHTQPQPETCDGKDNDCDGAVDEGVKNIYYRDRDGDGFGDSNDTKEACTAPGGYVAKPGDCDDDDKQVFPGQTQYFSKRSKNGRFDYNCNGKDDKEYTSYKCNSGCKGASRQGYTWPIPGCGWTGYFVKSCSKGLIGCRLSGDWRSQKCR